MESRENASKSIILHTTKRVSNDDDEQEYEEEDEKEEQQQQQMELNEKMVSSFVSLRENDDDGEDVLQC